MKPAALMEQRFTPRPSSRLPHRVSVLMAFALLAAACTRQSPPPPREGNLLPSSTLVATAPGRAPVVNPISDGPEPFNRAMFGFNRAAIAVFFRPLAKGWRFITPVGVRKSVHKMGYNLQFPTRFFGTLLEGKFGGSCEEVGRFVVNTTIGILGLFDPATRMHIPKNDEDFGQAFGTWGIHPGGYLHLPIEGPSTGRDAIGGIFDMATDLAIFGTRTLFRINDFTFDVDAYDKLLANTYDPYAITRDLWSIDRQQKVADYEVKAESDGTVEPTFGVLFIEPKDPQFFRDAVNRSVFIEATGGYLPYSVWLQKKPAPLIYILPGVGSHRFTNTPLTIAELAYNAGFSVAVISNALNWEFLENASVADVPGYPPADAQEVYNALSRVRADLDKRYPGRVTSNSLLGMSLGALHTLWIAADQRYRAADDFRFERFVAIEPPTDVPYALAQLDEFYQAPMQWPEAERIPRMQNTLLKAAALLNDPPDPEEPLPLTRLESNYLIGLNFRYILRDTIYLSHARDRVPSLPHGFASMSRQPIYDRVMSYSYMDYFDQFIVPYYEKSAAYRLTRDQLVENSRLWSVANSLISNNKVRVFENEDDFLLQKNDIQHLHDLLGNRLTVFPVGGHLGNLGNPDVQKAIMDSLSDLLPQSSK